MKTGANGEVTRLRDVARIELGAGDFGLRALLDNKSAVAVVVFQAPGSNALALSSAVRATMAELKTRFPQGMEWSAVYDPTVFVRDSIHEVIRTLLEATLMVVIVVVLFLQTWRASIIPLAAVPISIVGTFAVMLAAGFSINTLSLFGLVLAIGIVVDDAIVVVENVERHIEEGLSPLEASHRAMEEVSGPIIAIALVLCAVFVPVAFISGLTGQFYRQFALTIAFSTLISAFNSLTLSPALAARAAQAARRAGRRADARARIGVRLVLPAVQPRFASMSDRYGNVVRSLTRRSAVALVVYARPRRARHPRVLARARRVRADAGQAVSRRHRAACPTRRRSIAPKPSSGACRRSRSSSRASSHAVAVPWPLRQRVRQQAQRGDRVLRAQAVRGANARGDERGRDRRRR